MASLIKTRSVCSFSRASLLMLSLFLIIGCTTTALSPKIEPEDFYPFDWPEFGGAGDNCREIEGTFENKGEVVDSRKIKDFFNVYWQRERRDAWLSDMFIQLGRPRRGEPSDWTEMRRSLTAMRSCERVRSRIEPYVSTQLLIPKNTLRLIMVGTQQIPSDLPGQYGPCASLTIEPNWCKEGVFYFKLGGVTSMVGLGMDGSLVVRHTAIQCYHFYCEEARRIVGRFRKVQ